MERAAVKQPPAVAATPLAAAGSAGAPSAAAPSRGPHRLADFALGPQAAIVSRQVVYEPGGVVS